MPTADSSFVAIFIEYPPLVIPLLRLLGIRETKKRMCILGAIRRKNHVVAWIMRDVHFAIKYFFSNEAEFEDPVSSTK